jgi:hypothetical protein
MAFQTSFAPVPEELESHAASQLYTPLADALKAQAQLSMMDWPIARAAHAMRVDEAQRGKGLPGGRGPQRRLAPTSRALTLAEAQQLLKEAGVEGRVKVFEGQREAALKLEIEREQTKQKYERIIAHANQDWGTQFLIGAAGFTVDFADPVNLGTMLIPGVGTGKVVYGLTKAAAKLAPAASKLIVRAGAGAYQGAVSTALAEPLNYAVHQSLGDDYGLADSVENVATNAVGGGVLHALGGVGLDLYRGLRPDVSPEATIRVLSDGAEQLSALEPVNVAGSVSAEAAAVARSTPPIADQPAIKKRSGSGYARNSVLMMAADGASGERVTILDLASINAVRREYEPVQQAGASLGEVYRIERDGEVIVFRQSAKVKGSPTTFIVERLRGDDIAKAGPLSKRRTPGASGISSKSDPLVYIHPPKALAERLSEKLGATVDDIERLTPEELYRQFRPDEMKGHTIETKIGQDAHRIYGEYASSSEELRVLGTENSARPDSGAADLEILLDLKRDSPRGRRNAQETRRKYWLRLNKDTVFPLYGAEYEIRIAALKDKVVKAWDEFEPNWREELAARKAKLAAEKAADKARNAALGNTTTTRKKRARSQTDTSSTGKTL